MDVSFACSNCQRVIYLTLSEDVKLECPECGSTALTWLEADLSQMGCA